MIAIDLHRYTNHPDATSPHLGRAWAHCRRDGEWVTWASDGRILMAVPGKLGCSAVLSRGLEHWDHRGAARAITRPVTPTHRADLTALRTWSGSPDWPRVPWWSCERCNDGWVTCPRWSDDPPHPPVACGPCLHAEICMDGIFDCPDCRDLYPIRPGHLGPCVVNQVLLARVLEPLQGAVIAIRFECSVSPIHITDGRLRAVVMPMLQHGEDVDVPVFDGLEEAS